MSVIDELHVDFLAVIEEIGETNISLRNTAINNFRKSLLLSAASFFEKEITEVLKAKIRDWGGNRAELNELVRVKVIERQYHTLFNWDGRNANKFFKLFGTDFGEFMASQVEMDNALKDSIAAFIEVGRERNRLVHSNFGSYTLEKTFDEIFTLYSKGKEFVDSIPEFFEKFESRKVELESRSD